MSSAQRVDQAMAAALQGRGFGPNGKNGHAAASGPAAVAAKPVPAASSVLRPGDVHIGDVDGGSQVVGLNLAKLIEGRLLIQGVSGAGKSWTLRRLLEQTAGLIQQIVVDPEGEFSGLADMLELVRVDASKLDAAAIEIAGRRAREHRVSVLLDLSQIKTEPQMIAVAAFLSALVEAPREHWHPVLVAVDEAHLFAPFGGQRTEATSVRRAAIGAMVDLMSLGRKRGIVGVLATARLARMSKSVASTIVNFLIGANTLDLDIKRAAETIGWHARKAGDRLPLLSPGEFVAVGPGFSQSPAVLRVGPVESRHLGVAPVLARPPDLDPAGAARLLDLDALVAQSESDAAVLEGGQEPDSLRAIRGFIRDRGFADAGRIWGALIELVPDGARVSELAAHLGISLGSVGAALSLLDLYGAVEFTGEDGDHAVRIAKGMAPSESMAP